MKILNIKKQKKVKKNIESIKKVSIVGTNGIPANYGGFETLAENLANFANQKDKKDFKLAIYCSGKDDMSEHLGAELRFINIRANGVSGIIYDILSILDSVKKGDSTILILGLSGAIIIPIVRLFSNSKLIINLDGIEWKRQKWGLLAKAFLRFSEIIAVYSANEIITDNLGISDYIENQYSLKSKMIAYGGDNAINTQSKNPKFDLPNKYALSICRIEPENNIHIILESFSNISDFPIVFIGNWEASEYGKSLKNKYSKNKNINIYDPIYDISVLKKIRSNSSCYVHGHSAGGTNPSLVEIMHFKSSVIAFDCVFNRHTTNNKALYFKNADDLTNYIKNFNIEESNQISSSLNKIANQEYSWERISEQYFKLFQ